MVQKRTLRKSTDEKNLFVALKSAYQLMDIRMRLFICKNRVELSAQLKKPIVSKIKGVLRKGSGIIFEDKYEEIVQIKDEPLTTCGL